MPFTFNAIELCVVTINEKPWTRGKEVCWAFEYNKKTADIVKTFCSRENYDHKWQLNNFLMAGNFMDWPKDLRKDKYYTNEEGMYELLFSTQQPKQKTSEGIAVMCYFLMFDSSLVISYMRWKLKIL